MEEKENKKMNKKWKERGRGEIKVEGKREENAACQYGKE
jgi:hypothetical protein